jgi:hypothetical protein
MERSYNFGEVAEWSNAAVLKTARPSRVSRVRIPPSPPREYISKCKNNGEMAEWADCERV